MSGIIIVGMGLPGSGKSSIFTALADLLIRDGVGVSLYKEPEEDQWPAAVSKRDKVGHITALTWFRSARVPGLYAADSDRADGKVALVDSYYDKLVSGYFDEIGFDWLMKKEDPYREPYKQIIALDRKELPDVDCVVTFVVDENRWKNLILGRGRTLDRNAGVFDSYATQRVFVEVSDAYCAERSIPHVKFENVQDTILNSAQVLRDQLMSAGVL